MSGLYREIGLQTRQVKEQAGIFINSENILFFWPRKTFVCFIAEKDVFGKGGGEDKIYFPLVFSRKQCWVLRKYFSSLKKVFNFHILKIIRSASISFPVNK